MNENEKSPAKDKTKEPVTEKKTRPFRLERVFCSILIVERQTKKRSFSNLTPFWQLTNIEELSKIIDWKRRKTK